MVVCSFPKDCCILPNQFQFVQTDFFITVFIRLGPELYIESLDVLLNAWDGEPDSMSSANLLGICRFVELYHSEYSKSRLIAKLRQVDAFTIFRLARTAGVSLPGKTKYLQQVYTIYNGGSRRAALPLKF